MRKIECQSSDPTLTWGQWPEIASGLWGGMTDVDGGG